MLFRRPSPEPLWRDEFPVEAADERYVTRRQFAKFLTLTSLGLFVGNLWILARGWLPRRANPPELVVARAEDLPVGGVKLFSYPGPDDPCILIRITTDGYVAYSQKCTHLSCAVYYAQETNRLVCPCHRGGFAIEDGRVLAGPPPRPLPRVAIQRRGDSLVATAVEVRRA